MQNTGVGLRSGSRLERYEAKDPKSLGQPLRTVLFSSWLTAMKYRINDFNNNPSTKALAIKMGILTDDGFPYLQWDPDTSKHARIQQDPLTAQDDLQILEQLQQLIIHPNVIGRFHPLRTLTEGMVSDVIPWTLEIQNRAQEARMHPLSCVNSETLQAGPVSTSYSSGQDDPRTLRPVQTKILHLQLINPHQHSYAHAVLLSILWTASCMQDGLRTWQQDLRKFLQWLSTQSKLQPIWQNLAWQTLTKPWSHPLRQHDPALFLQYLQPMIFAVGEGIWQARAPLIPSDDASSCQVSRSGHVWPILLPACSHEPR